MSLLNLRGLSVTNHDLLDSTVLFRTLRYSHEKIIIRAEFSIHLGLVLREPNKSI